MSIEKIEEELRWALEDATPGPWHLVMDGPDYIVKSETSGYMMCDTSYYPTALEIADARFAVAANPFAIRALLDELSRLRTALVSVRGMLEVEYHDDGRIACVAHESGGLREMVRLLDATLARALSTQVEERE